MPLQSLTCDKHVVVSAPCGCWLCESLTDRQSLLRHGTLCPSLMEQRMRHVRRRHVQRLYALWVSHFIKASAALCSSCWSRSLLFVLVASTREMTRMGGVCVYSSLTITTNVHHHWKVMKGPWQKINLQTSMNEFKLIIASSFSSPSVF